MRLKLIPFATGANSVRVSNTATVDWIMLEIVQTGKHRLPSIALEPNSSKDLSMEPGAYRFYFHFQKVAGPATIAVQVATPTSGGAKPNPPKEGKARVGEPGLTSIAVSV